MAKYKVTKGQSSMVIVADQEFVEEHYPDAWESVQEEAQAPVPTPEPTQEPTQEPTPGDEPKSPAAALLDLESWKPADQESALRLMLAKLYGVTQP